MTIKTIKDHRHTWTQRRSNPCVGAASEYELTKIGDVTVRVDMAQVDELIVKAMRGSGIANSGPLCVEVANLVPVKTGPLFS